MYIIFSKELFIMSKRSIKYSEDFKKNVVKLYYDNHRSASSLAREYHVTVSTVTRWIKQYQSQSISLSKDKNIIAKEYTRLEKENQELKEETSTRLFK